MTLRVFLKWTVLFFLFLESLPLIGSLLILASKIGHWNEALSRASWGPLALELTVRFAIVGLILSAYLRLENLSQLPLTITRQSALLTTGAVQSILLAIIALYVLVAERMAGRVARAPLLSARSLSALALGSVIAGLILRNRLLGRANDKLRRDPHDANGLSRWQRVTISSMLLAAPIGSYGFILRARGAPRTVAWPFFAGSVALLFLWRTQMDGGNTPSANPSSNQDASTPVSRII